MDLGLAERELRSAVSLCDHVKEGETRACVCTVRERDGCLETESGIRLVALDPREGNLNGRTVVIGAATRPSSDKLLVASGMRSLGQEKHVFDLEGWVVARSERRVSDSVYWIKLRCEEKDNNEERNAKRSKKDDLDDVFDVYDAEYGYVEEMEDEMASHREVLVDVVIELSNASSWALCAPGCKVGVWGARKSYLSSDVQWTAAGVSLVNAECSEELLNEFSCYRGEITSIVHSGHLVLDNDLPCLLAVPRFDLLPGMQVQVWHAHPVWDGPALVLCPFSSLLITGYSPLPEQSSSTASFSPQAKPLPTFCSALPAWARVWLSRSSLAVSKHASRALLLSLGSRQPSLTELSARSFPAHSSLNCPLYNPDDRVPDSPVLLAETPQMPTQLAPFPFAHIGSGPLVMLQSSDHVMPIAVEKPAMKNVPAPKAWLLCVMASE